MNIVRSEKKLKAIQLLKQLDIFEPYIAEFIKDDTVCYFENCAGFWAFQNKELLEKAQEIEKKYDCLVYAITHEYTSFGELYSFLIVTDYSEEWDNHLLYSEGNKHYAFSYVWNKDDDWCSEFGTIEVTSFGGGIKRTA